MLNLQSAALCGFKEFIFYTEDLILLIKNRLITIIDFIISTICKKRKKIQFNTIFINTWKQGYVYDIYKNNTLILRKENN